MAKDDEVIAAMAKQLVDMEDKYDYSMRGVFLDQLVTQYVSAKANRFAEMFNCIMNNQKDDKDSYGDIDTTVHKIKVINFSDPLWEDDYDFSATGLYIRDNPTCSNENQWVIIKIIKTHKEITKLNETKYVVFLVKKEIKSLDLKKFAKYGDFRDENYVVSFIQRNLRSTLEIKDYKGMIYTYNRFKHLMDNLHSVFYELTELKKEEKK